MHHSKTAKKVLDNILLIAHVPVTLHIGLIIRLLFQSETSLKADIVSYHLASSLSIKISVSRQFKIGFFIYLDIFTPSFHFSRAFVMQVLRRTHYAGVSELVEKLKWEKNVLGKITGSLCGPDGIREDSLI